MPTIRPYRALDWKAFIALDLETSRASLSQASSQERESFVQRWPEQIKSDYQWSDRGPTTAQSSLLVLESDDGNYAGHLWISEQVDFFTKERKLFITTIAIVEKYRGRGWGELLMRRAEQEATARNIKKVSLGVEASNSGAIKLYAKLGYRTSRLAMEQEVQP